MKSNELRIGNLVGRTVETIDGFNSTTGDPIVNTQPCIIAYSVSGIEPSIVRCEDVFTGNFTGVLQTHIIQIGLIHGIPLTPDWLERLGFNLDRDHFKTEGRFPIYCDFKIWARNVDSDGEWEVNHNGDDLTYVRYVHQLQNIYFDFTSDQLTSKTE